MTRAAEWQGAVGNAWAAEWRRTDRSFAGLAATLDAAIVAAAPGAGGDALDVGCGAGATSLAVANACPTMTVTGIDVAADLIDIARQRAAQGGVANVRFATADLNDTLPDLSRFDLIFSRHGVMFTDDPGGMFGTLHALAQPGAALVFSCFRAAALNRWAGALVAELLQETPSSPPAGYSPGPFAFADPVFVSQLLNAAGWSDVAYRPVDFEYVAGAGADPVADAIAFFSRIGPVAAALKTRSESGEDLRARLRDILVGHRVGDRVTFPAAAWIWTAIAGPGERK